MKLISITKPAHPISMDVDLPASKSISNRLLILHALSDGRFNIENLSTADDTVLLKNLLRKIRHHQSSNNSVEMCELDAKNAGTVLRFLTAFLCLLPGRWMLTGSERMRQRPVKPLVDALLALGADIRYSAMPGFPPLIINGSALRGGKVQLDISESSQFASALMLIAPFLDNGLTINFSGEIASLPYIKMTAGLLKQLAIDTEPGNKIVRVKPGKIMQTTIRVEPDWSAASYWFQMAAIERDFQVLLKNLSFRSLQGDAALGDLFMKLGVASKQVSEGILIQSKNDPDRKNFSQDFLKFNLSQHPDLAPAIAATCVARNLHAQLCGISNLRIKESDRLQALQAELSKINPEIFIDHNDDLVIPVASKLVMGKGIRFKTYADHRMAMALAPLALSCGEVIVEDPDVVNKSYPEFWKHLANAGFEIKDILR